MASDKELRAKIRKILDSYTNDMIYELDKITEFTQHPDTDLFEFEIYFKYMIVLYPMTFDGDQVWDKESKERGIFVGSYKIPINIDSILNDNVINLNEYFTHMKDPYLESTKELIEWLSDCWDAVKDKIKLPVYASVHEYEILFDLTNKKWGKMWDQYK